MMNYLELLNPSDMLLWLTLILEKLQTLSVRKTRSLAKKEKEKRLDTDLKRTNPSAVRRVNDLKRKIRISRNASIVRCSITLLRKCPELKKIAL